MMRGHRGGARVQRAALFFAMCAATLWGAVPTGSAQAPGRGGLGLNWVRLAGAEQCIASVDLMNRIERRAGRILFVRSGDAVLTLDGYVRPSPGGTPSGWAVTFEISDAHGKVLGRRELGVLAGSDCSVVTSASELIFDLLLDPDGVLDAGFPLEPATQRLLDELLHGEPMELDPATLPKAVTTHTAAPQPSAAAPSASQEPSEPAEEVASESYEYKAPVTLDIAGAAMLGTLPKLAAGVALNMTIPTRTGWAFELGLLTTVAEQTVSASFESQGELRLSQLSGSVLLCPPRWFSMLLVCAGGEYGQQSIVASGFPGEREPTGRDLVNVIAQGTLRVNLLSWWFVRASVAVLVPLLRQDYVYDSRDGDQQLFRIAPVGGRAELGLGLHI
jgi:hypothetical protein